MIPINKRKIGVSLLISFLTMGIYAVYWQYLLVKNTKAIKHDNTRCISEMLCLIFVPFYSWYWWFTRGKVVKEEFFKHGYSASSNEVVFLILTMFGFNIVSMAIMQSDFNSLSSTLGAGEDTNSRRRLGELKDEIKAVEEKRKLARENGKKEMEKHAIFNRAAKPYLDAEKMVRQYENYQHFDEIAVDYDEAKQRVEEKRAADEAERLAKEAEEKAYRAQLRAEKQAKKSGK